MMSEWSYNQIANKGPLKPKEFNTLMQKWNTLWCVGAEEEAEEVYIEIQARASDQQWERFCKFMNGVDLWIGATGKASLRQKELYMAQKEGRKHEWPGSLSLVAEFPRAVEKLIELSQRHKLPIPQAYQEIVEKHRSGTPF